MDTLTILGCPSNRRAAKTHRKTANGIKTEGYSAGSMFQCNVFSINNIAELGSLLTQFERMPNLLAIRGEPKPDLDCRIWHRRTKHAPPNYQSPAAGHHHVMVDIDKLPLPSELTLSTETIPQVLDYVAKQLPEEFHHCSFFWQLSASAGLRDQSVISVHLWYWLEKKTTDEELKRWAKAINAAKGFNFIDTSLFNDVQAHYTAAPIFIGMDDPFPERSGLVEKLSHVVALELPAEEPLISRPQKIRNAGPWGSSQAQGSSGQGFDHKLSQIGDHEGGEGFHGPIISAIASYVATVGRNNVNKEWLLETVRSRVLAADSTQHEPSYIDIKASREYLMPAIDGALQKYGDVVQKRSRVTHGVSPHFRRSHTTVASARQRVSQILKRIF